MRRTKPHPKKEKELVELRERLDRMKTVIVTDYRGLTVSQTTQLRSKLRQVDVEYHIAKNTLVQLAAKQLSLPDISALLVGPTAVAFGFGDEIGTAKALVDFAQSSKIMKIKGGLLGRRVMSIEEVTNLATSPSRQQLFSQMLGTMQSPAANVLGVLAAPARSLLYLLQARAEQLESQAGA